jgi:hypothetical protein
MQCYRKYCILRDLGFDLKLIIHKNYYEIQWIAK